MRISLDSVTPLISNQPVADCPAQQYCNIPSFRSDPNTQTHFCTNTSILSILLLWPMLTQDIWRPKRIDKALTTPGHLAHSEKAARADKMSISAAVALVSTLWSEFFQFNIFSFALPKDTTVQSLQHDLCTSVQSFFSFSCWFFHARQTGKKNARNSHLFYESDTTIQRLLISSLIGCWISKLLWPVCGIDGLPVRVKRALQAIEQNSMDLGQGGIDGDLEIRWVFLLWLQDVVPKRCRDTCSECVLVALVGLLLTCRMYLINLIMSLNWCHVKNFNWCNCFTVLNMTREQSWSILA